MTLHVLEPVEPVAPPEMSKRYAPELEDQKKPAFALLDRIADELRKAGFSARTSVEIGDVRETIIERADCMGADLIPIWLTWEARHPEFLVGKRWPESVACHAQMLRRNCSNASCRLRKHC